MPQTQGAVIKLVGSTFNQYVMDVEKDVFVLFCAPWHQVCNEMMSEWEALSESVGSISDLVIAMIDATANEVEQVVVSLFPTIILFTCENKTGV